MALQYSVVLSLLDKYTEKHEQMQLLPHISKFNCTKGRLDKIGLNHVGACYSYAKDTRTVKPGFYAVPPQNIFEISTGF